MSEAEIRGRLSQLYQRAEQLRKEIQELEADLPADLPAKDLEYWMAQEVDITAP